MKTTHRGMVSVEVILATATGALVLLGLMQVTTSNLLPKVNETVAKLLSPGSAFEGSTSNIGTNSNSQAGSADSDESSHDRSDSESTGTGDSQLTGGETSDLPSDNGEAVPIGDGLVKDFIAETIKQAAKDYTDKAVETAAEELENFLPSQLPMGVELDLEDWDLKNAELNQSLVKNIGIITGAINAADGLTQAEQQVKDLADEGKYREAFGTIFSGSSRFITDTILNSKAVDTAIGKLPSSVQVAIQSTVPNAVESVTQTIGENVFDSVGKKINDRLWDWYDKGYAPRPRIPRDYNFVNGG